MYKPGTRPHAAVEHGEEWQYNCHLSRDHHQNYARPECHHFRMTFSKGVLIQATEGMVFQVCQPAHWPLQMHTHTSRQLCKPVSMTTPARKQPERRGACRLQAQHATLLETCQSGLGLQQPPGAATGPFLDMMPGTIPAFLTHARFDTSAICCSQGRLRQQPAPVLA